MSAHHDGTPSEAAMLPPVAAVDAIPEDRLTAFLLELNALQSRVAIRMLATQAARHPSSTPSAPSRALDVAAVGERIGMSREWIYRASREGRLPFARRIGRRVVFDEAGLDRWLTRRRAS